MNILSIEDNEDVREITETIIGSNTRIFYSVGTVEEALETIFRCKIDLIISDFNLGDETFYNLVQALEEKNTIIPTVLYSGYQKLEHVLAPQYIIEKIAKPNIEQLLKKVVDFEKGK